MATDTDFGRYILVVDDLIENTFVLKSFLSPMGYHVEAAMEGAQALEMVAEKLPDVVLLDLMMPGMDGFEVCRRLKQDPKTRHIPVIIVTGMSDRESNLKAVEAGADDFLLKPFDRILLEARIRSAVNAKVLHDELVLYKQELEDKVARRTAQIALTQQITVFSLAKLAESRDNDTGEHLERMRCYARLLSEEFVGMEKFRGQLDADFVGKMYQSTPLHDIGKVGIPDRILLKPGKLTVEEFDIMKHHSMIGGDTLKAADIEAGQNSFLAMGRDIAYYHHEKWDGSGYPFGLSGEDIPLVARITALADVYDALSSRRPYKEPFSHEKSKVIILEGRGSHFDPDVVDAFLTREAQFLEIRENFQGSGDLSPIQILVNALGE
ncbi:MAG: response regulator [Candidatus Hydrogenedentes bacterium]|nr:response regulator [Candidatus Hydrogenedentota bacterium]